MPVAYATVKNAVIGIIDDFTDADVVADYGSKYNAKTKLAKVGIGAPALSTMAPRFNKVMRKLFGDKWQRVGAIDLVGAISIGDLILLACGQSGTVVPQGEPT